METSARARREAALLKACRLDVVAFKPGNVSLCSPGHDMQAADFLASARAAVPWLCAEELGCGARMSHAMNATMGAVGCNTNLGIVLLLAPLACAAERGGPLRSALGAVLAGLDVLDSDGCFAAIRVAQPAGLGEVGEGDVHAQATMALGDAMALAAERDSVARQYGTVFADVFEHGVPLLASLRARWHSLAWATTACYLEPLARW
ncbi:MAG: triphosphoribosyl-dephospho-CoA synthase, partial [Gammaproteobacteria bacterium]